MRSHLREEKHAAGKWPGTKPAVAACYADRPSFPPLPPCLAGRFGRSRWTDRLRPNFYCAVFLCVRPMDGSRTNADKAASQIREGPFATYTISDDVGRSRY